MPPGDLSLICKAFDPMFNHAHESSETRPFLSTWCHSQSAVFCMGTGSYELTERVGKELAMALDVSSYGFYDHIRKLLRVLSGAE